MVTTRLFRSKGTQAVRLPEEVAFPEDGEVTIAVEGDARVITSVAHSWDRFFDSLDDLDVETPDREQPARQERDWS